MATIKELLQNFCYRTNLPAPTSFVGVSSPNEQQLLSIFESIGNNLRNRPQNWPQLKRSWTFTTVTDQRRYRLPGDFYRILESSQWDTTNNWPLVGPTSDARMSLRQYSVIGLTTQKAYRLIGPTAHLYSTSPYSQRSAGSFEIDPAGDNDTDELFLGYVSCNWIWPRDWVASTAYTAGNIRAVDGYVYICKTSGTSSTTRPSTGTINTDITDGSAVWRVYTEPYLCNASNTALNDSDLCLFDDELMIEGMRWAYKQAKGLEYLDLKAEWERNVNAAFARFNGPTRFSMAEEDDDDDFPKVPLGSWNV